MRVLVAYVGPQGEAEVEVVMPPGALVADAVSASNLVARFGLDPALMGYAIYGQRARPDTPLADGDRVELTRPLIVDPKEARRRRAVDNPLRRQPPRRKRNA